MTPTGFIMYADEVDPAPDPNEIEAKIAFGQALLDGTVPQPNIPAIKAELMELDLDQLKACIQRLTGTQQVQLHEWFTRELGFYDVLSMDAQFRMQTAQEHWGQDNPGVPCPYTDEMIHEACDRVTQCDWSTEWETLHDTFTECLADVLNELVTPEPSGLDGKPADAALPNKVTQANHDEA